MARADETDCGTTSGGGGPGQGPTGATPPQSADTLRALVVFAKFPGGYDHPHCDTTAAGWPDGSAIPAWADSVIEDVNDPVIPGSITHFYAEMSGGVHIIRGTVHDSVITVTNPVSYYASTYQGNPYEMVPAANLDVVTQVIQDIDTAALEYDLNGDGFFDQMFVYYRSPLGGPTGPSITMFQFGGVAVLVPQDTTFALSSGSISVGHGSGTTNFWQPFQDSPGHIIRIIDRWQFLRVAGHEYGHHVLQDHIDTLGPYGVMDGTLPSAERGGNQIVSGYERLAEGWIAPMVIDSTVTGAETTITLHNAATAGSAGFAIIETHKNSSDIFQDHQYFLLECRSTTGSPYLAAKGSGSCAVPANHSGLLVMHVARRGASDGWYGGQPWKAPAAEPELAEGMFASDGSIDPALGADEMQANQKETADDLFGASEPDLFQPGAAQFGWSNAITPYTNPNTNLYADSLHFIASLGVWEHAPLQRQVVHSGISIYNVQWANPGQDSMYVSIRFDGSAPPSDADTIRTDTTWDGRVQLTGDVVVDSSATLTVTENAAVYAAALKDRHAGGKDTSRVEVIVANGGGLDVQGQPTDEAVFSSSRDPDFDHFRGPETGSAAAGDWRGFRMLNSAPMGYGYDCNGTIAEATVSYADKAIALEENCAPSITGVRFLYNSIDIFADSTDVFLSNLNPWSLEAPVLAVFTNATRSGQDFSPGHAGKADFIVQGPFNTTGTSADSVRFRPEFPNDAVGDDFGGIYMDEWSAGSQIEYLEVSHAANPIFLLYPNGSALRHSTVHHFKDVGIWFYQAWGDGMVVESNLIQRDDTTSTGDNLDPANGNLGILIERSTPVSAVGNRIVLRGAADPLGGAGIEIRNNQTWCLADQGAADSVKITQNRLVGPGQGVQFSSVSGVEFDWACGPSQDLVYVVDNNVTDWNKAGLYFYQSSDVQVTCNTVVSNRRNVDFSRTDAPAADTVRLRRNTFTKHTVGTGLSSLRTDRADKMVLGPDGALTGDNVIQNPNTVAKFIYENDPDDLHVLNAIANQWYVTPTSFSSDTTQIKLRIVKDPGSGSVKVLVSPPKQAPATPPCNVPAAAQAGVGVAVAPERLPGLVERLTAAGVPDRTALEIVGPTPFRFETSLSLAIAEPAARVTLRVYDVVGRRVRELADAELTAGRYLVHWDGRDAFGRRVASGTYFVSFESGGQRQVRKLVRIR